MLTGKAKVKTMPILCQVFNSFVRKNKIEVLHIKYGRLTVIGEVYYKKIKNFGNYQFVKAKCDCDDNIREYRVDQLKCGNTKSCGCLSREKAAQRMTKHGLSGTRIYSIWKDMRKRCNNSNSSTYKYYGRKGIKVCDEWNDFMNFYNWSMKNGYADELTIDRVDSSGNYEPNNCRWITKSKNIAKRNKENIRITRVYKYTSPDYKTGYFNNAAEFARNNNLCSKRIYDVCNKKIKQYKGWHFEIIKELNKGQETISRESTQEDELPVEAQGLLC